MSKLEKAQLFEIGISFLFLRQRPQFFSYPIVLLYSIVNKNDMNRSKMIANYNGFGLERVWIRKGLD